MLSAQVVRETSADVMVESCIATPTGCETEAPVNWYYVNGSYNTFWIASCIPGYIPSYASIDSK